MSRQGLSPARLEAFSDGVIAVIITILVLELRVPEPNGLAGLRSFIYPLGEEHGFDAIVQVLQKIMGGMFSGRDLQTRDIAIHMNGNAG